MNLVDMTSLATSLPVGQWLVHLASVWEVIGSIREVELFLCLMLTTYIMLNISPFVLKS